MFIGRFLRKFTKLHLEASLKNGQKTHMFLSLKTTLHPDKGGVALRFRVFQLSMKFHASAKFAPFRVNSSFGLPRTKWAQHKVIPSRRSQREPSQLF